MYLFSVPESLGYELQLPSSSHEQSRSSRGTNGWTLGRAIIEENSRHYNSLVCPLAALSSCFISTNFLLLLHDDGPWAAKQVSSTEFWAFPGLSSFCFFLSFFLTTLAVRSFFLETNWIKDRRPRSKSVMWSLSKTTFEKILWSKTPSSTNKVSTTLYRVLASSTFEYFVRGVCNIFHNFLEARLEFRWKIV